MTHSWYSWVINGESDFSATKGGDKNGIVIRSRRNDCDRQFGWQLTLFLVTFFQSTDRRQLEMQLLTYRGSVVS